MTVEGDPWKEALERVAREWLADLSPHGADVGEDAAMMAAELIAALDASPAPDREKVAEALQAANHKAAWSPGEQPAYWLRLADAAIAAGAGTGLTPEEAEMLDWAADRDRVAPGPSPLAVLSSARAKLRAFLAGASEEEKPA